jgi:hypothetical protein
MPHTGHILHGRYAVVSCHVERPLDDEVWSRFAALQARRPGGFAIAALMRPPAEGEDESVWVQRAREAASRGPFGLHTHWTAPDHARPTAGDPAALVREQALWLREAGVEARLFCGGGWYLDEAVAEALAELGYADCTATAFRPEYLAGDAEHLRLEQPAWLELSGGRRLLELPSTHSIGCSPAACSRATCLTSCTRTFTTLTCSTCAAPPRYASHLGCSAGGEHQPISQSFSSACDLRRRCRSRTVSAECPRAGLR